MYRHDLLASLLSLFSLRNNTTQGQVCCVVFFVGFIIAAEVQRDTDSLCYVGCGGELFFSEVQVAQISHFITKPDYHSTGF